MMLRKRLSFICLALLFLSLISNLSLISAQGNDWSKPILVSSSGEVEPIIDGLMDEGWSEQNNSYYEFDNGQKILLYGQHSGNYLFILIIAQYRNTFDEETFSLYLSTTEETVDIFDKKQLISIEFKN